MRPIVKDSIRRVKECKILFEKIKDGKIKAATASFIFAEIAWVCQKFYGLDKETTAEALKRILNYKNIVILDKTNIALAVDIYQKHNLKFIDGLIASIPKIQQKEMVVISYDKDFDKLDIIRKEPKDLIFKRSERK